MTALPRQPYTLDRVVRLVITIAVILGALWLINYLKDVLLPFCVACLGAYMLEPFVQYNRRLFRLKGRTIAVFITLFETVFLIAALCFIFVPRVVDEMQQLAQILRNYSSSNPNITFIPAEIHRLLTRYINFSYIADTILNGDWMGMLEKALSTSWGIITGSVAVIMSIINWVISLLYLIFIMIDYERIFNGFRRLVPPKYRNIVFKLGNDIKTGMNHYFRGQALVALLVGILFSIGFLIIDLPMAVVLGLFIGLLNMVPYLQLASIPLTALLCLVCAAGGDVGFWTIFLESMAVYCIVQAIQDLILVPKIMGKVMGLNPAIILFSLSIWGSLLGIIGLIIALPLTTLIISYYDRYIIHRAPPLVEDDSPSTTT